MLLQESTALAPSAVAPNVVKGVLIAPRSSKAGRQCSPAALTKLAELAEGKAVNINAATPGERRSYRDRIGTLDNVTVTAGGVRGDLLINPKHALASQIVWDAENIPEAVAVVCTTQGRTAKRGTTTTVESIDALASVDLVATADGTTTTGLFESTGRTATHSPQGTKPVITAESFTRYVEARAAGRPLSCHLSSVPASPADA